MIRHALAALIAVAPLSALGTQFNQQLTLSAMVVDASQTVHGTVESVTAELAPDGRIVSRVRLSVENDVPRTSSRTVEFAVPGGVVDGVRMSVAGGHLPDVGDELVAFLQDGEVMGLGQGLYSLVQGDWLRPEAPRLPDADLDSVGSVLGDSDASMDCASEALGFGHESGWAPRGTVTAALVPGKARGIAIQLLGGVNYRVTVCGDDQAAGLSGAIFDSDGRPVGAVEGSQPLALTFTAGETGEHLLAVEAEEFIGGAHRSSVTVLLSYR
jgi:hypothetical protein